MYAFYYIYINTFLYANNATILWHDIQRIYFMFFFFFNLKNAAIVHDSPNRFYIFIVMWDVHTTYGPWTEWLLWLVLYFLNLKASMWHISGSLRSQDASFVRPNQLLRRDPAHFDICMYYALNDPDFLMEVIFFFLIFYIVTWLWFFLFVFF